MSYLVAEGSAWVLAGYGPEAQWYRNLLVDPLVEVILPGRTCICRAEEVRDPDTRRRIIPRLARSLGVPGFMIGCDPRRASDERILELTAWVPLIRFRPIGEPLVAGPDDPGGRGWMWRQTLLALLSVWIARACMRIIRSR